MRESTSWCGFGNSRLCIAPSNSRPFRTLERSLSSPPKARLPSCLVLASNHTVLPQRRPGRGSGVFSSTEYPVLVPTALTSFRAFLRLYARDVGTRNGSFAMAMIGCMEEYVDDDGFLDGDPLKEPFRTSCRELREGEKPVRQWKEELKDAFGRILQLG